MQIYQTGNGEPIIFIHGLLGNHSVFENEYKAFSSDYNVIAYDYLGHGCNTDIDIPFSLDNLVNELLRVYDETRVEKAHLCALSFGSYISNTFAIRYPERVFSLCNVGAGYNNPSDLFNILLSLWQARNDDYLEWIKRFAVSIHPNTDLMPNPFAKQSRRIFYMCAKRTSPAIIQEALRIQLFFDMKRQLTQLQLPIQWILGEYDFLYKSCLYDLFEIIPHVEYAELPDAGHVAHVFQPKLFEEFYRAFLQNVKNLPAVSPTEMLTK